MGITVNSVNARLRELKLLRDYGTENNLATTESPKSEYTLPTLPSEEMPTEDLVEHLTTRSRQRFEAKVAREWIPIQVNVQGPVGITFFGDPHIDDDYCDWDNLRSDIDMINKTECLWAVNLGDVSNNWIGRLQAEYAKSEASAKQGFQLAEWFIKKIKPLIIIRGNHDAWSGQGDPLEYIHQAGSMYEQWKALVELQWPNGRKAVLDIAHDHVGTSQFHPLHGQVRQARFNHSGKAADLYISGHRHTWGLMSTEMQGRVVWMCRARGFKDHGEYEVVKGFEAQKLGHTITAIFDPSADTETGFLSCFAEPQEAAEFLTYKRGRY